MRLRLNFLFALLALFTYAFTAKAQGDNKVYASQAVDNQVFGEYASPVFDANKPGNLTGAFAHVSEGNLYLNAKALPGLFTSGAANDTEYDAPATIFGEDQVTVYDSRTGSLSYLYQITRIGNYNSYLLCQSGQDCKTVSYSAKVIARNFRGQTEDLSVEIFDAKKYPAIRTLPVIFMGKDLWLYCKLPDTGQWQYIPSTALVNLPAKE